MLQRTGLKWVIALVIGLFTVSGISAQEDATPTGDNALLELLVQAAQATEEASEVEEAFRFADVALELHRERLEDGGFVIGDPDAPITIVEFADWACPHCQTYREQVEPIIEEYVLTGQARFEYRILPTAGGQQSAAFGVIAECADEQVVDEDGVGYGFWLSYDVLFDLAVSGDFFGQAALDLYVEGMNANLDGIELDAQSLLDCGRAAEAPQVLTDIGLADEAGVSGTPALMVRYADVEGSPLQWIEYEGTTYNRGGASYEVIAAVIEEANQVE